MGVESKGGQELISGKKPIVEVVTILLVREYFPSYFRFSRNRALDL